MSEEEKPPENGVELARCIGADLDEGVVVALFPATLEKVYNRELSIIDSKGNRMYGLAADCGPWGLRLLDLESPTGADVKWWRVKEAAGIEGLNLIPVRWEGPIGEIPGRYFGDDAITGVRFYQHGPWFFFREKPVTKEAECPETEQSEESSTGSPEATTGDTRSPGTEI